MGRDLFPWQKAVPPLSRPRRHVTVSVDVSCRVLWCCGRWSCRAVPSRVVMCPVVPRGAVVRGHLVFVTFGNLVLDFVAEFIRSQDPSVSILARKQLLSSSALSRRRSSCLCVLLGVFCFFGSFSYKWAGGRSRHCTSVLSRALQ